LQEQARSEAPRLRASQSGLGERRQQLAALESRQRITSRAANGTASARPTMPWPWPNRRATWRR
jgi:hypothetical protein